jgi:hypothetical protein
MYQVTVKSIILCAIFMASSLLLLAQKKEWKAKYGKLSEEEISMSAYKEDKDAPAVVLFDKGRVYYSFDATYGWVQIQERHKRIKIFKKEAYHYANIRIPLFGEEKWMILKD